MYSTCLFCHNSLGANEIIEVFPVGRRLAFDADKGRLWVICTHCGRWNLTPQEERWETIEECERQFRETRLRVSTENIGLARLAEGLELVRIGPALRTEMAAWRYGRHFGHRRKRQIALTGGGVAAVAAVLWGGPAAGLLTSGAVMAGNYTLQAASLYHRSFRTAMRLDAADGNRMDVTLSHIFRAELAPDKPTGQWALRVPYKTPGFAWSPSRWVADTLSGYARPGEDADLRLTGDAAIRAAGQMLPRINRFGGSRRQVRTAVELLEHVGDPARCFAAAATTQAPWWRRSYLHRSRPLGSLPSAVRLALEMASHEETERAALEGDLQVLRAAWCEAEEIAAIADNLLLPPGIQVLLDRYRGVDSTCRDTNADGAPRL